jgi:hypothetical protein
LFSRDFRASARFSLKLRYFPLTAANCTTFGRVDSL